MQWSTNCKVFKDSGLEVWVQFELRPWIATLVRYFYSMISSQMFYGLVFKSQRNLQSPFFLRSPHPDGIFWNPRSLLGKPIFFALLIFYEPPICGSEHVNKPLDFEVPYTLFSNKPYSVTSKVNFNHVFFKFVISTMFINHWISTIGFTSSFQTSVFFFCCQALFDRAGMNVQAPGSSV